MRPAYAVRHPQGEAVNTPSAWAKGEAEEGLKRWLREADAYLDCDSEGFGVFRHSLALALDAARREGWEAACGKVSEQVKKDEATCREAEAQRDHDIGTHEGRPILDLLREQRHAWHEKAASYEALGRFIAHVADHYEEAK